MTLTPEQELENAQIKVSYFKLVRFFGLSEKDALHPNAADWMIDLMKQWQTSSALNKAMRLSMSEKLSVTNYSPTPPLQPKPEELTSK